MRTLAPAHPQPFDASSWFRHVADRAVPGLETASPPGLAPGSQATVRRLVRGATGPILATLRLARDGSRVEIDLDATTPPDLEPALARVRRWLDLDTDVFPAGDLVLRYALAQLPGGAGAPVDVRAAARRALVWQPWRGYVAQHLWSAWAAQASAPAAHR